MSVSGGRLLGLDLGSRRIGVAVSDSGRTVATGVTVVPRAGDRAAEHAAIAGLAGEYGVVGVVVGVPYSMSGAAGPAAAGVLAEVEELRAVLGVEVSTVDERLTTVQAAGALRAAGRSERRRRPVVDQTAAAVILQSWMDADRARGARR
ncbi:MAG TPA: Holliday junction resolvase RuvX [Acidimicrobiales bacterium]|nr:Holliday junction resolvase RuvX [Acidimicrobiales bacterium]